MRKILIQLTLLLFLLPLSLNAAHLVGGEIFYEYLGNNEYRITMIVYRDCFPGPQKAQEFDGPANIAIFRGDGTFERLVQPFYIEDSISTTLDYPCVEEPATCIKRATYVTTVTLPPSPSGYTIAWQRFARANDIVNLFLSGDQGMTLISKIPPSDNLNTHENNAPQFNNTPPILICGNQPLEVDQSATDPDGDSLAYEFCAPLDYDGMGGAIVIPDTPAAPPYNPVSYNSGFSASFPMTSNPPLEINDSTGIITGTPTQEGRFVVGICIKEYRNGKLIGTHLRDYHFQVQNCPRLAYIADIPDTFVLCKPFEVTLSADNTNAVDVIWDFGDPTTTEDTSTNFEPTYTYPSEGTYQVTLIATNAEACKDTTTADVNVENAVRPSFDYQRVCPGEEVQLTSTSTSDAGNIIEYQWIVPNGDTLTGPNPTYTFQSGGSKSIRLTIFTDQDCSETTTQQVTFHPVPNANFTNNLVCIDKPVEFEDQTNIGGGGSISSFEWDFGDGSSLGSGSNPSHTYTDTGTYDVQLVVTSNNGCVDTIVKSVTVEPKLTAVATEDTSTCNDKAIQLFASGGNDYVWSPTGSLSNPNVANPVASPSTPTTYRVIVSDECYSDTTFVDVSINPNPAPEFTYDPKCANEPIQFTDQSTVTIEGWQWDFGDGSTSTDENPAYNFNDNGPHQVTLEVTNQYGCDSAVTTEVVPWQLPDVKFQTIQPTCLLKPAIFIDQSEIAFDNLIGWQWTLGDGTTGTNDTITNTYQNTGTYPVTLRVTTDKGCIDSLTKNYIVPKIVIGDVSPDTTICPHDYAQLEATGGIFYQWSPGASLNNDTIANPLAGPLQPTTYEVIVADTCYRDTVSVTVETHPIPDPEFDITLNCAKDPIEFMDASTTSTDVIESWEWTFDSLGNSTGSSTQFTFDSTGPYEVTMLVINDFGCDTSITKTVEPYPLPEASFEVDTIPCPYESIDFEDLTFIESGNIDSYNWDFGDGSTSTDANPSYSYGVPDTYSVVLTTVSDQGCEDTAMGTIAFKPYVEATASDDFAICVGDTAELTSSGGLYYQWEPMSGNLFSPEDSTTFIMPEVTTTYEVKVSDDCYTDSAQVTVTVNELPEFEITPDTSIYLGEVANLRIIPAADVDSFYWYPQNVLADGADPNATPVPAQPDSAGYVFIYVKNESGCEGVDSVFISIDSGFVELPNAFSPNGDGLNDYFYFLNRGDISVETFRIYNRWGELVYSYSGPIDQSQGWDGTFRGKAQDPGVYAVVYEVRTNDFSQKVYRGKGNVTLIR